MSGETYKEIDDLSYISKQTECVQKTLLTSLITWMEHSNSHGPAY